MTSGAGPSNADVSSDPIFIPPTLSTLTGFRGLLLHRKYLQSSAVNLTPSSDVPNPAQLQSNAREERQELVEKSTSSTAEEPVAGPSHDRTDPCPAGNSTQGEHPSQEELQLETENGTRTPDPLALDESFPHGIHFLATPMESETPALEQRPVDSATDGVEEQQSFGDPNADKLLLQRLISLFALPGIMSRMK